MKTKNNWSDLFTNVSSKIIVVKNKQDKKVFEMDVIVALILVLFFWVLGLVFIILVTTNAVYFEVVDKATIKESKK